MANLIFYIFWQFCEGQVEPIGLENWVPSERPVSARENNLTITNTNEELWLSIWTFTVGVSALGDSVFGAKWSQDL